MSRFDLGLIDGDDWDEIQVNAVEAQINKMQQFDTFANRPAAGDIDGSLFYDSTNKRLWCWDTTASRWQLIGGKVPRVMVSRSVAQSCPASVISAVTWDLETFDSDGIHSTSTNDHRLTIPAGLGGLWMFGWTLTGSLIDTGAGGIWLSLNGGVRYANTGGAQPEMSGSSPIPVAAGDFVELLVYNATGVTLTVASQTSDQFWGIYIGPT